MRAYQFVTLFLVITVVCGCSHRRVHRRPVSTSSCACESCRFEKEQLIESGAIPAGYFGHSEVSEYSETEGYEVVEPENKDLATASESNSLSPEYSNDVGDEIVIESPFTSGNPVDMNSESPQDLVAPVRDEPRTPSGDLLPGNIPELKLKLEATPEVPLGQSSIQDTPEVNFRPFDSELSKINSESGMQIPVAQQPSILRDEVLEISQPGPGLPPLQLIPVLENSTDRNNLRMPNPAVSTPLSSPEEQSPEVPGLVSGELESQPYIQLPAISSPVSQLASVANRFAPKLVQQSEAVVEGELHEEPIAQEPIVLYARSRLAQQRMVPTHGPGAVQSASVQQPVKHQSIVQDSKLDPVYGLPLSNNVSFNSLPTIEAPMTDSSAQAQHLQVHIHHEYGSAAGLAQGHTGVRDNPSATNVQVVYRDDQGRIVMAPPAKIDEPVGDQRTYYIPPEQILRLKAVSPIDQPQSAPSVASIQMRDTIVQGGKHLLTIPEHRTRSVQMSHGLPGIDHEKLREAFQAFPTANPLR